MKTLKPSDLSEFVFRALSPPPRRIESEEAAEVRRAQGEHDRARIAAHEAEEGENERI